MKDIYIEKEREISVIADVDVLVCGGGPAGVGAAIRAARLGVSVMVVEMLDCLGGMATSGMMSHYTGDSSSSVMREIFIRTREKCDVLGYDDGNMHGDLAAIHHEAQKIALDELTDESGVKKLYYTKVCDVIRDGNKVAGVIVENKSGRGLIKAKTVIDSTGDGDVAFLAGVPYCKGRENDGKMQPATLMFKVGGVDYSRAVFPPTFETEVPTEKGELQALGKSILPFPAGHVLLYRQPTPGTVCCNMTNALDVDATDAFSVSKATEQCRAQIPYIIDFLHKYAPGYENCWLMSAGSLIGIRETRHFEGEARLEKEDILSARYYEDWVVRKAYFNLDVHNMTGNGLDVTGVQHKFTQQKPYTIPYGCLIPKNVDNLFLSGRNISGSHIAHSSFRAMPICMAVGEAAGVAAALFVKNDLSSSKDVDVKDIQKIVGDD